jgi:death-on-curing protein
VSLTAVRFLSLANVLAIHDDTLAAEGGCTGVRDWALLESAIEMPRAMFGGVYFHAGLAEQAAALHFHLCQNHAFVDGNKRVAAFAAVLFPTLNGIPEETLPSQEGLESVTLALADGAMTKAELTAWWLQTPRP